MRLEHEYVARKLNSGMTEFMPATEPTKFELVIKFKTAKALGLTISPIVLMRAQKVFK
jgi:putative ABC transport system substrate-binding protein